MEIVKNICTCCKNEIGVGESGAIVVCIYCKCVGIINPQGNIDPMLMREFRILPKALRKRINKIGKIIQ